MVRMRPSEGLASEGLLVAIGFGLLFGWRFGLLFLALYWVPAYRLRGR